MEYVLKKTYFTPFHLTTAPVVFVAFFNQLIMTQFGFFELNDAFFMYLLVACVICFFASFTAQFVGMLFYSGKKSSPIHSDYLIADRKILKSLFSSVSICLFIYSIYIIFFLRVDWANVKEYFSSGLPAHAIYFTILGAVFLYGGTKRMTKKELILYIVSIFPLFLYGTRGWIFITILSSIYLRGYIFNIWPNKLFILLSPVFGIFFMMISYLYRNFTGDVEASFSEIFGHVMGYFVSGVQGANALFNSNLSNEPYNNLIFNAFYNIKSFLLGGGFVSNSTPYFFQISDDGNLSNVTTIFGTILYGLGLGIGSVYLYFLFFMINMMFIMKYRVINIYFLIYFSIVSSGISLGFFEYYLGLLFFVESVFILLFLSFIVKILKLNINRFG